jgi:hypothetical protein
MVWSRWLTTVLQEGIRGWRPVVQGLSHRAAQFSVYPISYVIMEMLEENQKLMV